MSSAPWSLHLLSEVLAAFTLESPTALRDVVSRVGEAVDAEVMAILQDGHYQLCTGLTRQEKPALLAIASSAPTELPLDSGLLHLFWAPLNSNELLVVGRFREAFNLEERALLRGMGRCIQLSTKVLAAVKAEQEALLAEQVAKEQAIREATCDHLTGLPNRRLLLAHLASRLALPALTDRQTAVLFIDLDRFKQINDLHGHTAGDEVLRQVGQRLSGLVRDRDLVGRISGDEFVVVAEVREQSDALALASRVLEQLQRPLLVQGRELPSSGSIGIALAEAGDDPERLLANADLAMYSVKQKGVGRFACFDASLREQLQERAQIEEELRAGLAAGEIRAWFQPILSAVHGTVVGFEALARWQHPHRGLLAPAVFIPIAEEAGLLRELDAAVLNDACLQIGGWNRGLDGLLPRLSVNISATSLADPLLSRRVREVLSSSGFPGDQLFLEITETTLVEDVASAFTNIADIKTLGIRLAVDDFGTGYSSLRYLRRFPVGILKIDRSFVDGLGHDLEDEVIVETVIRMARSLGIEVVAEGVETPDQVEILRRLGCHYLQGFLYGRPADAASSAELYATSLAGMLGMPLQSS
jgi:diguanylate cyclase (GGDEF)-like protein